MPDRVIRLLFILLAFYGKKVDGTPGIVKNNNGTGVAYEEVTSGVYQDSGLLTQEHGAVLHG